MSKSNAERQAAYRNRRPEAGDNGERRINTWVTTGTALALNRLAHHQGVTKRAILEKLIQKADDAVVKKLDDSRPEWDKYFNAG